MNETQRATMTGPYPYCGANGVLDYVKDMYVLDDDVILIAEDGGHFDEFLSRLPIAYRMRGKDLGQRIMPIFSKRSLI